MLDFLEKIVSGGQSGVDLAALEFVFSHGISVGGRSPRGPLAEDGPIPDRFPGLLETESPDPAVRTTLNVRDSDATLILSHGPLAGGSLLTLQAAARVGKPALHLDLDQIPLAEAAARLRCWLQTLRPGVLNVAGPRASQDSRIAGATQAVLEAALRDP